MNKQLRAALVALFVTAASLAGVALTTSPGHADVVICEQYGSTTIQGQYVVQNNRWGTSATQCINATNTGFQIIQADGSVPTNGAPKSYPSVFYGCHYTNCSPGTQLPRQLSQIGSVNSSISYTYVSNAVYNASYDIWLDPTPKRDGVNQLEIMIWLNRVGSIQPIGSSTGNANVAGRNWDVWTGNNGGNNVISFVAPSAIGSLSFNVMDFVNVAISRGMANSSWYLTSVQAGFEPWVGGAGLAVNSFSTSLGGSPSQTPTSTPTGNPSAGCSATSRVISSWNGGHQAEVTVRNNGSAAINGWQVGWTLGSGQVTQSWSARVTSQGSSYTATNEAWNGSLAPGASTTFGYVASSSSSAGSYQCTTR